MTPDRADFIPDVIWVRQPGGGPWHQPLDRRDDPDRWSALVRSDEAITTQVDAGSPGPTGGLIPTSSSSQPSLMRTMIDALGVRAGMTVLEIGTGTGWNAALLAEARATIITVEVDPDVAEHARQRLAGHPVEVITGDGMAGHPEAAPYDRLIATAAVKTIPYAWIEQTRPGGRIVTPWTTEIGPGVIVRLDVTGDGTASGPILGWAAFMVVRGQAGRIGANWRDGDTDQCATSVDPARLWADRRTRFALGVLLPAVEDGRTTKDGVTTYRLAHARSGSWAACTTDGAVRQHGPRRLWDELEAAYAWWAERGEPDRERFGMTVTPDAVRIWLDEPGQQVPRRV